MANRPQIRNDEEYRHQCETRHAIRKGRNWFEQYVSGVAKARGKPAAEKLWADVKDQTRKGNDGSIGAWK